MNAEKQALKQSRPTLVRDAMQIQVVGVVPEMTVRELIQVLLENGITGAPVLDPQGKVAGVVSVTDVLQLAAREAEIPAGQLAWEPLLVAQDAGGEGLEDAPHEADTLIAFTSPEPESRAEAAFDTYQVRDIMTPMAFAIRPTDTIASAVDFMLKGRIHRALVVEDGVLFGIITPFDVLQAVEWE